MMTESDSDLSNGTGGATEEDVDVEIDEDVFTGEGDGVGGVEPIFIDFTSPNDYVLTTNVGTILSDMVESILKAQLILRSYQSHHADSIHITLGLYGDSLSDVSSGAASSSAIKRVISLQETHMADLNALAVEFDLDEASIQTELDIADNEVQVFEDAGVSEAYADDYVWVGLPDDEDEQNVIAAAAGHAANLVVGGGGNAAPELVTVDEGIGSDSGLSDEDIDIDHNVLDAEIDH
jgi:hypothetical protein